MLRQLVQRQSPSPHTTALAMPIPRPPSLSRRSRNNDENAGTLDRPGKGSPQSKAHRDRQSTPRNQLSPLSPTFGPRKGLVPSGTVDRRRRVPRYLPIVDQHILQKPGVCHIELVSASSINTNEPVPNMIVIFREDDLRDVLWEPGWSYIEGNGYPCAEKYEEAVEEGIV